MNQQQACAERTEQQTRRVFVDLWANETLLQRRRIVLEVPADCTDEELKGIGGNALDDWANAHMIDSSYETEESEDFEVLNDLNVETGVPERLGFDLKLVREDGDELVLKEEEDSE